MNHAYFVPLPESIYHDKVTGEYRQQVVPLDAPLDFVPRKPSAPAEAEDASTHYTQEKPLTVSMQSPLSSLSSEVTHTYDEFNIDVDASDEEDGHSMQEEPQTFTGAFDGRDDLEQSSISSASQHEEEDDTDMILDIEGDEDVMDSIPPWKMRLMDQEKHRRVKASLAQTSDSRKRKHSPSPPFVEGGASLLAEPHQEEGDIPEKKKKKTVRFA